MGANEQGSLPAGLSQCEDCGAIMANLGGHDCDAGQENSAMPTREEREALIADDDRPLDANVLISRSGRSYHEFDATKTPLCGNNGEMKLRSREYAQTRGKSPCRTCLTKQREALTEMLETDGSRCASCNHRVCHLCDARSGGPRGRIEKREQYGGHFVCATCAGALETVDPE